MVNFDKFQGLGFCYFCTVFVNEIYFFGGCIDRFLQNQGFWVLGFRISKSEFQGLGFANAVIFSISVNAFPNFSANFSQIPFKFFPISQIFPNYTPHPLDGRLLLGVAFLGASFGWSEYVCVMFYALVTNELSICVKLLIM